ncbi:MAG: 16S rRNA processing protein RimM [Candidatus Eisenbacteria bacterium]|nr:16S rRNA processing protein RimM [Candidatus Latescibacterota bacterium]MBD3301018.1 16S rRNA processing protein RimM [Candidatus Eisenbacteria bacterium]
MAPGRSAPPVRRVLVGRIRRPVGLRGEVIVEPTGEDPERFAPGKRLLVERDEKRSAERDAGRNDECVIARSRPAPKGTIAVLFEGIATVEAAETLRGRSLFVRPEELPPLPEGVHYNFQLIGLEVVDDQGERLGSVREILETGSNDVYCVEAGNEENGASRDGSPEEILIPAVPDYVAEIDLPRRRIRLAVSRSALGIDDPPV